MTAANPWITAPLQPLTPQLITKSLRRQLLMFALHHQIHTVAFSARFTVKKENIFGMIFAKYWRHLKKNPADKNYGIVRIVDEN